ncbi:MAG: SpoIIE family protein phosphatase [Oscillospiraceae bacterium]
MQAKIKKDYLLKTLKKIASDMLPIAWQAAMFGIGFLCAAAPVYGELRPLGLAFAAAVISTWALSAAAGAALGYAITLDITTAAPYLCAICIVALVRTFTAQKRQKFSPMIPAAIGALGLFITKAVLCLALRLGGIGAITTAAECLMVIGIAYLFMDMFKAYSSIQKGIADTCLIFGYMIMLIALAPYNIFGLQLARIVAGICLLSTACKGDQKATAMLGVAGGAALLAASPSNAFAALGIAAGALAASCFVPGERIGAALVYFAAGITGAVAAPSAEKGLLLGVELCVSGIMFLLIPHKFLRASTPKEDGEARRAAATELSARVEELAASLSSIGQTIGKVCEKLPKKGESYADACNNVADGVCAHCNRRIFCWVDCYSDTISALQGALPILESDGCMTQDMFPSVLLHRCHSPAKLAAGLTQEYCAWQARRSEYTRGEMMREALTEQYCSIAAALEGFAKELWNEEAPDKKKGERLESLMLSIGAQPLCTRVAQNRDGRMHATVKLPRLMFTDKELGIITNEVTDICRRPLSPCVCTHTGGVTTLDFYEKALLEPVFAFHAIAAESGVCGDAVRTLCDGHGMAHALLCDGMGTGKAAAVDGHMAASLMARLVQAGFGAAEAARLVNVALALKSSDEAGAALDVLSVNLYTGNASLFKAGGAPTFLLRGGKVMRLGEESLPIGILSGVIGKECKFKFCAGDIAILVSDGAIESGEDWLCQQLELTSLDEPNIICVKAAEAAARRSTGHSDDISVVALQLKAV